MDNPLFGNNDFMPSPIQGGMNNPMWSAGPSNAAASPGMATGMRRLGDMQPWEIPAEQPYTVPGHPTASAAAAMGRDRPEGGFFRCLGEISTRGSRSCRNYLYVCRYMPRTSCRIKRFSFFAASKSSPVHGIE